MQRLASLVVVGVLISAALGCGKPAPQAPTAAGAEDAAPQRLENVGLATPESVLYLESEDVYLVSNINGSPLAKDDNGFISKVAPDGTVIALKWIDGASDTVELNAPKGMGVADGKLYVTDIDSVRVFDLATGAPAASIAVAGAAFLNDISVSAKGTVYVSDTGLVADGEGLKPGGKDAIYTVANGAAQALISGEKLGLPNGLQADADGVWVVTWSGQVYHVKDSGEMGAPVKAPGAQLDGIVALADGRVLVSSWEKSAVFVGAAADLSGKADGGLAQLFGDLKNPADIGFDTKRSRLLTPLFQDNAIVMQSVH
jgi:hypothetical protein